MIFRRMDLKIDYAFKQVFGKPGNEPILMAFLNAALQPYAHERITWIEFQNIEYGPEYEDDKRAVLDILARTANGEYFNVEIQLANLHDMDRRTLYYWSRIYARQLTRGRTYLELRPTVTINILNFRYLKPTERYHTTFHLLEDEEHFILTDVLAVHFMELPKLLDQWELGTVSPEEDQLVRWLLLLEAEDNEAIRERLEGIALEDPVLKQAFEQWDEASQDMSTWWAYEQRRKAVINEWVMARTKEQVEQTKSEIKELESVLTEKESVLTEKESVLIEKESVLTEKESVLTEKESALTEKESVLTEKESALEERESIIEQEREGMIQKVVQAHDQGRDEGKEESQKEIALRMLALGFSLPEVATLTGLTESELEALRSAERFS